MPVSGSEVCNREDLAEFCREPHSSVDTVSGQENVVNGLCEYDEELIHLQDVYTPIGFTSTESV